MLSAVVSGEERRAGEGVVLGLREGRCLRGLADGRCLGSGRGRAPGPCRESSEEDEEERERERTPVVKRTERNERTQGAGYYRVESELKTVLFILHTLLCPLYTTHHSRKVL